MKKLVILLSTLLLSLSSVAANFQPGEHYQVLETRHTRSPMVTELFSFYCPHCFTMEPIIKGLKAQLPANAKFEKAHVSFMGGEMGTLMSKAYATMVSLKVEEFMVPAMFEQVQVKQKPPQTAQEMRAFFVANGVDGNKFDAAFNGFAVDSMVRRYDQQFKNADLKGVPAVVVNNKYLVKAGSVSSAEEYHQLVNFLLTK
ncbi:thiol:disulfide interchange protein DsbA/DsbL [Vibrio sp. SCSIO 43136]|uniref:thiol:disulfide interchange protein DsbA/DsbL n=1 Tax=Vibrio sp. SCSIO 43136 TaxID=2819101 RepID=UPI0020750903|nr:thiol:disulfide interchange protein DsbA/DsbL [Vibrio sp. SCSIO 43136]USD65318.1 thiol:disulfide interchange protein DsbA/DsbL [Vibrio sp. SCSIO 43136]